MIAASEAVHAVDQGCGIACEGISTSPQELSQQLLQFGAAGQFEATSNTVKNDILNEEIAPIARGENRADCGIDTRILQSLVVLVKQYGYLRVSELNRRCPYISSDVSCAGSSSMHCESTARAVDLWKIGGVQVDGGAETEPYLAFLNTFMPAGTNALQGQCGRTNDPAWTNLVIGYIDDCTHQHVDLRNATGDLNLASAPVGLPGGTVVQAVGTAGSGWQTLPTPITVSSGQISTVNMGGSWPQIWVNEGGTLVEIWGDSAGWHKVPTGIQINPSATISAIRAGNEPNARIYVNDSGSLLEAYGNSSGWHLGNTGVQIGSGQISAVYTGGTWGRIMVNEDGFLKEVYADSSGWHKGDTGIALGNAYISAVNLGGTSLQVMASQGGYLYQIAGYGGAWHKDATGLNIGTGYISAVDMGGGWPQVAVNGGGYLQFAVGTNSGWQLLGTGKQIGPGLVPALNMQPGVTTNNWPSVITLM